MLIALPVGIGVAIFLTELCPRPLRRPIGIAIELLAGIPSIIYGIWGFFVFAPWFQLHVQEPVINAVADIPVLGTLFGGSAVGIGIFTAGRGAPTGRDDWDQQTARSIVTHLVGMTPLSFAIRLPGGERDGLETHGNRECS